jgi:hypothetical protein
MTKREALRQTTQENTLLSLGFTRAEAEQLRRISMTLQRWFELECGTGEGQVSRSIERDGENGDGKPFLRIQYPTSHGYVDRRHPVPDRETGARKRLDNIINERNKRAVAPGSSNTALGYYVQGDPRGAALYILRPGDVPADKSADSYYTRGICIY